MDRFGGWRRDINRTPKRVIVVAFFHPDCTVGSGVSPDHAGDLSARRLAEFAYYRSGIVAVLLAMHPAPKDGRVFATYEFVSVLYRLIVKDVTVGGWWEMYGSFNWTWQVLKTCQV